MDKKFYVYVLYRSWDGSPCYVGKGQGDRVHQHAKFGEKHYNKHLANIIKKAGGLIPFEIVFETSDEATAFERERALILQYGRADQKQGTLCNHTDGGDGVRNTVHTEEYREIRRQIATGRRHSSDSIAKMLGNKNASGARSEAAKMNIKAGNKGRSMSESARLKIKATLAGVPKPAESIRKRTESRLRNKLAKQAATESFGS